MSSTELANLRGYLLQLSDGFLALRNNGRSLSDPAQQWRRQRPRDSQRKCILDKCYANGLNYG